MGSTAILADHDLGGSCGANRGVRFELSPEMCFSLAGLSRLFRVT